VGGVGYATAHRPSHPPTKASSQPRRLSSGGRIPPLNSRGGRGTRMAL